MLNNGDVIYIFISEIVPPKNKFIVCVNKNKSLFLLINTQNRGMYECAEILATKYSFLKNKNRFISCSRYFKLPKNLIKKAKLITSIDEEDMIRIYKKIQESKNLSPKQKQEILKID